MKEIVVPFLGGVLLGLFCLWICNKPEQKAHRSATIYADVYPEEYGDSTVITTLFFESQGDTVTVEKLWRSETVLGFDSGQARIISLADSIVEADSCRVQVINDGGMRRTAQRFHFCRYDWRHKDSIFCVVRHFYFDQFGAEGNGY